MVRRFLTESVRAPAPPRGGSTPLARSLADAVISLDDVSCVHPGAAQATPHGASHRWSGARGLAVSGANGAGKSTLALALLGLLAPASGRITIDDVALDAIDFDAYRKRIVYVPQGAFIAPGESIAWHLRLYLDASIADARLEAALAEVGLLPVLAERAARSSTAPLDVPAGELSGGERQRMHLARALIHDAELVILDEPEAALDDGGRHALRDLLERLAQTRKVLIIAHDLSVVPPAFDRLECKRAPTS
jgi:ABC-type transport system involved in cytochrome bd biosynthesis fused ATPase/permease subunit